jgi:hypothetical protein
MLRRFLNVVYDGVHARINVTDMDLSQVQEKFKIAFENITVGYSKIQFYDQANKQIDDLNEIPDEYYKKRKEEGLELVIRLIPSLASSRQSTNPKLHSREEGIGIAGDAGFIDTEQSTI